MRTEIFIPFAFSPEIKPGKMGPIFEMRTYTHAPGEQGKVAKTWEKALPARVKISPLVAMWYAECGSVNRFVHIWSYPTLEARNEMRNKALAKGVWPPSLALFNPYCVIAVNPDKSPNIQNDLANQFIEWIISLPVQEKIQQFGVEDFGQSLFTPDSTAREAHPTTQ